MERFAPNGYIVETVGADNAYFAGVQFHPEFKSRPNRPHPLFLGLIRHSLGKKRKKEMIREGIMDLCLVPKII